MSRSEWEHGTLKFSSVQAYKIFKKGVIEKYLAFQKKDLETLKTVIQEVKAQAKGKRGFDWAESLRAALEPPQGDDRLSVLSAWDADRMVMFDKVVQSPKSPGQGPGFYYAPRKTPRIPAKAEMKFVGLKTTRLSNSECSLSFNDKEKSVTWSVPENNHARDWARDSTLGKLFFEALKTADWGRSGGGVLVGNDEYHRENQEAGEGSNYVTEAFGPLGKKQQEARYRASLHGSRSPRRASRNRNTAA